MCFLPHPPASQGKHKLKCSARLVSFLCQHTSVMHRLKEASTPKAQRKNLELALGLTIRWSVQMCSRGSIPIGSTSTSDPWTPRPAPCGSLSRDRRSSVRLDYLRDREAVPGSDPDGEALSMDDWVPQLNASRSAQYFNIFHVFFVCLPFKSPGCFGTTWSTHIESTAIRFCFLHSEFSKCESPPSMVLGVRWIVRAWADGLMTFEHFRDSFIRHHGDPDMLDRLDRSSRAKSNFLHFLQSLC